MQLRPTVPEADGVPPGTAAGLMALTGWPDGPMVPPPAGMVRGLDTLVREIRRWSCEVGRPIDLRWGPLLTGRAALLGLSRQGRRSANGSCRLLAAVDGWVAVNLPRPDDLAAVPALVGRPCQDAWAALADEVPKMPSAEVVGRARLVGIAAATLPEHGPADEIAPWGWRVHRLWEPAPPRPLAGLRVVDLSAMWAGPLAAQILAAGGATVTKVESATRPDGARAVPEFYRWLHPVGQAEAVVDFGTEAGRRQLRSMIEAADVVIESSRPRALEQLGAGPLAMGPRPGRVWLSITGHGRDEPGCQWVAFGDDAAVAGGLVGRDASGAPVFCGDAVADPVTGLVGALAVLEHLALGGGVLVDVAMSRCAAALATGAVRSPR